MLEKASNVGGLAGAAGPLTWIVVSTHPHRERVAIENLARQEFLTYCPVIRAQVRHARQTRDVLRPLFPGYLFAALDFERQRWRPILSTLGVRSVVCDGDAPSRLDPGVIDSLHAREVAGAIVRPSRPFEVGQEVRMAGGAFDGFVATILALDEKDRVVLLLDLLNRPVKAHASVTQLRPA
jgi:transcriptional antiterminator RfaH